MSAGVVPAGMYHLDKLLPLSEKVLSNTLVSLQNVDIERGLL